MAETTSDLVEITGIRARGFHGVFAEERRDGQDFVVDIAVDADLAAAGSSDDLADTVNYAHLAALAVARIEGESFDLIERLASVIAEDVLADDGGRLLVDAVTVTVHKPQAPVGVAFGDVTVRVRRERPAVPVVIALGTNLGDRYSTLSFAELELAERVCAGPVVVSDYVETDPVGGPDQPDYLNAVAVGLTRLSPTTVLSRLHAIEAAAGRVRDVRWGPRTLDLDLVQYGDPDTGTDIVSDAERLTLPHPRAHERAFVLLPWLDADPAAALRVGGAVHPVDELLGGLDTSGVRAAEEPDAGAAGGVCGAGGCAGC
ncbi:2-amino-4-hydroxy-6-hydroxymethyldihydropteridine diphosphokinase [Nostocoides sp. F2B08]|uniref:2-amino-4-hydroxy-6- hydroxymethyldihydropteridine diphosphokinase n=1 Tax=Nostocoides sp. F2B08 TaxID=2653936 RepID=UPI001263B83B|nr:2-amino-4-hydroxy-6-hydroxymethyldihydropteridine diphosphokinase [Tetrasphaera sp. F2B08]KAB7746495.1 2-amino-4-hydroxy-6-hydroxymethyldihydropteridine diphosphokinase [Tetrasphaera sp. F2B08]